MVQNHNNVDLIQGLQQCHQFPCLIFALDPLSFATASKLNLLHHSSGLLLPPSEVSQLSIPSSKTITILTYFRTFSNIINSPT
ncbi:hypothetical protein BU16DRAFT_296153 [Lophium mytilinum]|uniref:Uncharacterized protein n=1 Tax=Lophium mytilinum TaxID=390894 RepID=A0A6A6R1C7_9PEZI|nr:hypothetical protein BU16DRAFT_296153 [Lophium mytilinum]